MKNIIFLFFLFPLFVFSQKKLVVKTDSTDYYIDLVNFSKKENAYKDCLNYSQKAIDFAILSKNPEKIAKSYATLGETFLELKKYDDAIEAFKKSIASYDKVTNGSELAYCNYYIGICYMQKYDFKVAETYFNNALDIFDSLNSKCYRYAISAKSNNL